MVHNKKSRIELLVLLSLVGFWSFFLLFPAPATPWKSTPGRCCGGGFHPWRHGAGRRADRQCSSTGPCARVARLGQVRLLPAMRPARAYLAFAAASWPFCALRPSISRTQALAPPYLYPNKGEATSRIQTTHFDRFHQPPPDPPQICAGFVEHSYGH